MECASCNAPLEDALILACDHNLCLHCASRDCNGADAITCRLCGRITSIDPESSQQLKFVAPSPALYDRPLRGFAGTSQQTEVAHRSVAETHVETPNRRGPQMSASCGQCDLAATVRCMQCQEELCSTCATNFHRKGRLAFHTILPLSSGRQVPQVSAMTRAPVQTPPSGAAIPRQCPEHPEEQVQYFCLTCETRPVCAECVFRGVGAEKHHSHLQQVVLVKKAFPAVRMKVDDVSNALEAVNRDVASKRRSLDETRTQLQEVCEAAKAQMRRGFAEIAERLKTKEQELCKRVDDLFFSELDTVNADTEIASSKMSSVDSIIQRMTDAVTLHDEVGTLTVYAEAKEMLKEPAPNMKGTKISISPEASLVHAEHVNAIHNAITAMAGLVPIVRAGNGAIFPAASKSTRSLGRVVQTSSQYNVPTVNGNAEDLNLMNAVSAAFADPLSPQPQVRRSPRPYQ